MLTVGQFPAPLGCLTRMLQIPARVASIAVLELRNCLTGIYRWLIRMRWISGFDK
jgi:hypothetical protein